MNFMRRVRSDSEAFLLFAICSFDLFFLLHAVSTVSISYYEARIFYDSATISGILTRLSTEFFGQNDYALRLPFIVCHLCSVALLYKISKPILKRKFDRVVSVSIFILLPGVLASAILVNDAGIIIFLTLLNIYFYRFDFKVLFYLSLFCLSFIGGQFLTYFIALFVFAVYKRDARLAWSAALLFAFCFYLFGFESGGKPRGYILDTISVFAVAFSPLIFVYFVYAMYRIWIKEDKDILWFVGITAFLLCITLSIRQRLFLEDFLPFCVIATPLIVRTFFSSYRVRLPIFRKFYKILAAFVIFSLCAGFFCVTFNEYIYKFYSEPKNHFAYSYHVAKELAQELEKRDIKTFFIADERLRLRLKFYGVKSDKDSPNVLVASGNGQIKVVKGRVTVAKFSVIKRDI
jgi:hypothetical protein